MLLYIDVDARRFNDEFRRVNVLKGEKDEVSHKKDRKDVSSFDSVIAEIENKMCNCWCAVCRNSKRIENKVWIVGFFASFCVCDETKRK